MQLTKPCLQCGKTITKPQTESLKCWVERHKYCSRRCLGIAHLSKVGSLTRFKVGGKAIHPILKGQHLSPNTQFTKDLVPWNKNKKGVMPEPWNKGKRFPQITGEKHHAWKGGVSKLNHLIRNLPEMKIWRINIFMRDGHRCVLCGRKRKPGDRVIIEADHYPMPFHRIISENNITSVALATQCKILWDTSNGRTLCIECHHRTTGTNQHKTFDGIRKTS